MTRDPCDLCPMTVSPAQLLIERGIRVIMLTSDEASYTSGAMVTVAGGMPIL